jgi:hypothetical protein
MTPTRTEEEPMAQHSTRTRWTTDAPAPFADLETWAGLPDLSPLTFWASSRRLSSTRRRVEMQGFTGLDDTTLRAVEPWLRLAPAICMAWTAVATAFGSAVLAAALVPFAAAGALGRSHPFEVVYQRGLRRVLGAPAIPPYAPPRRFACALATAWLVATATAFHAGQAGLGRLLGATLVATAGVLVTTGFCVPSWIYGHLFPGRAACGARCG